MGRDHTNEVYVWDPLVRVFHWALVVAFTIAFVTEDDALDLHVWAGYTVGALVFLRIVWGFIGPEHARFSNFVYRPKAIMEYIGSLLTFRAKRYLGHSPGGVILYDVLTSVRKDVPVDALVTVGSQIALFEETKCLLASSEAYSKAKGNKVPRPPGCSRWINVFDHNDLLGFPASGVFEGVTDFHYTTGKGVLAAHSSYFVRPTFYHRLRLRMREAGLRREDTQ